MARVLTDSEMSEIQGYLTEILRIAYAPIEDYTISPYHLLLDIITLASRIQLVLDETGK